MALNSRSASGWVATRSRDSVTMARVSASTSSGVFLIWYFMCTGLVLMNVWMRGTSGDLDGVPADPDVLLDGPRQAGDARALDLGRDRLDRLEVVGRGDREPGLDDVDAQPGELVRDLELLGPVQGSARRLFAVAQRRVEDPDVPATRSRVTSTSQGMRRRLMELVDPDVIRGSGRAGRRCLRIPPRGEEQQAAEEGEVAGAYPNVGLPAGLACRTATHGPGSLCHACVQAQATRVHPTVTRRWLWYYRGVRSGPVRGGTS